MPAGCVKVDRGTAFGNPFRVGVDGTAAECVALFRRWLTEPVVYGDGRRAGGGWLSDHADRRSDLLARLPSLRGRPLGCWCPVGAPCHADVLLELANPEATT